MPSEIAVPFRLDETGRIATVTNPDDQIRQHVQSLVGTSPGERVMLSSYGVPLERLLFGADEEFTEVETAELVGAALSTWEPGVFLRSVAPIPDQDDLGVASVAVDYARTESPTSPDGLARGVNRAVIRVGGEVREQIRG